jgi:hypothetical protein
MSPCGGVDSDIKGKNILFEELTLREEVTLAEGRTLIRSYLSK